MNQSIVYAFSETDTQLAVIKNSVASVLRLDEQSGLLAMYRALYGTSINMEDTSAYAISSKAVVYAGETIRRGQLVTAKWPLSETHERVGEVRNVLKHKLISKEVWRWSTLLLRFGGINLHLHYDYFESPCIIIENICMTLSYQTTTTSLCSG